MFINNEHTKEYYKIINARKGKKRVGYMEKHHIIPKSMGGSNTSNNLVWLDAAEHFRCHQLLVNMTTSDDKMKMWSGLWRMMNKQSRNQHREYTFTAKEYEIARITHSENHRQRMLGEKNFFYGKKHTDKTKKAMSERKKGKTYEEIFGKEYAEVMKERRSIEQKGKPKGPQDLVICPHCKKKGGKGIMKRWHFEKCKEKEC